MTDHLDHDVLRTMTPKEVAAELRQWAKAIDPNINGTVRKRLEALAWVVEGFAKGSAALIPVKF